VARAPRSIRSPRRPPIATCACSPTARRRGRAARSARTSTTRSSTPATVRPSSFPFFRLRRGYDLADELPALAGRGDADHVARVQSDYRQTLDEMLREHFVERLTRWSHARGALMREQAHGSPGNLLDLYAAADIPETEIFGVLGSPDADPLINKFASSAAHVAGKRLASAESFTWLDEHFTGTLAHMKVAADKMFLAGINHLLYHGTAYSPASVTWPGWQFYASMEINPRNAIWRDLPDRSTAMCTRPVRDAGGIADGDVLLYWPIWDNWHDPSRRRMDFRVHDPAWLNDKPFGKIAQSLYWNGCRRRLRLRPPALDERLRVWRKTAHGPEAAGPPSSSRTRRGMPPETFERLMGLVSDGATVIFVGRLPRDVPGAVAHHREDVPGSRLPGEGSHSVNWRTTSTSHGPAKG
jgi:hypothetical protein